MNENERKRFSAANRKAWNQAAGYHRGHAQYQKLLENFAQPGYSGLDDVETEILLDIGIKNKNVIQLCCNNGREILSVKNLGAGRCVGVDQSEAFLEQANEIAAIGDIDCEFIHADVYELPESLYSQFEIVYLTIGVMGWMPDLDRFLNIINGLLKPEGVLFIYEHHPILNMFEDSDESIPPKIKSSYFREDPWVDTTPLDYWGGIEYKSEPQYWIDYKLSDVIMACIRAGLVIDDFAEYPHDVGTYVHFENQPAQLPLSYSLVAYKGEDP